MTTERKEGKDTLPETESRRIETVEGDPEVVDTTRTQVRTTVIQFPSDGFMGRIPGFGILTQ